MTERPAGQETEPPTWPSVLIVGAGPTGLTLACELARRAVSFRLIEAAPGPQPGSRGKGLQPRTLEVFDDLGIVDRVLAHGQMAMPIRSTAPAGQVTLGGTVPAALRGRPDVPYPASLITPEWRTEEALRLRLESLGGEVEFDTTLVSLEQPASDKVAAMLVSGDTTTTISARWVVGCDGGHSVVRKQAGIAFAGETREQVRMIVADVEVDGLDRDAWHLWRHQDGLVALCPLPSTRLFQYQAGIAAGQDADLDLENLQTTLERRTGRDDLRLHEPEWSSLWRANVRLADRYRSGRVLLAGDAAHIHSPAGGQGMNTGIQDAHNLGWKLAAVIDGAPLGLLDTYEAERRPVAAGVLALSDARLQQTLDQKAMPLQRDPTTTQLGVGYRGSSLARDDRTGRDDADVLRAGDRAPDATRLMTTAGERRLFDLTHGGGWTLLDFGGGPVADVTAGTRTVRVRDRPEGPDDVVDADGQLVRTYGAAGPSLVLIRPDGYVGLISDAGDRSVVAAYLDTVRRTVTSSPLRNHGAPGDRSTAEVAGASGSGPLLRTPTRQERTP